MGHKPKHPVLERITLSNGQILIRVKINPRNKSNPFSKPFNIL